MGIPFYEAQDQLFTMKRSFMQNIEDLFKSELAYVQERQKKNQASRASQYCQSDAPDFGRPQTNSHENPSFTKSLTESNL